MGIGSTMAMMLRMIASQMSKEDIIEKIEEDIADFKSAVLASEKEDAFRKLGTSLTLGIYHLGDSGKTSEEILESQSKAEAAVRIIDLDDRSN